MYSERRREETVTVVVNPATNPKTSHKPKYRHGLDGIGNHDDLMSQVTSFCHLSGPAGPHRMVPIAASSPSDENRKMAVQSLCYRRAEGLWDQSTGSPVPLRHQVCGTSLQRFDSDVCCHYSGGIGWDRLRGRLVGTFGKESSFPYHLGSAVTCSGIIYYGPAPVPWRICGIKDYAYIYYAQCFLTGGDGESP